MAYRAWYPGRPRISEWMSSAGNQYATAVAAGQVIRNYPHNSYTMVPKWLTDSYLSYGGSRVIRFMAQCGPTWLSMAHTITVARRIAIIRTRGDSTEHLWRYLSRWFLGLSLGGARSL